MDAHDRLSIEHRCGLAAEIHRLEVHRDEAMLCSDPVQQVRLGRLEPGICRSISRD
jgi:hypothetical protein